MAAQPSAAALALPRRRLPRVPHHQAQGWRCLARYGKPSHTWPSQERIQYAMWAMVVYKACHSLEPGMTQELSDHENFRQRKVPRAVGYACDSFCEPAPPTFFLPDSRRPLYRVFSGSGGFPAAVKSPDPVDIIEKHSFPLGLVRNPPPATSNQIGSGRIQTSAHLGGTLSVIIRKRLSRP